MFSDNNYQKFIYSNVTNNYQYTYAQNPTYQLSYPIYQEEKLYQEDINKCLSNVNNDYNSYDASLPFDDCSYTNVFNKDVNSLRDSGNESEFYEDSVSHVGTKEQSHTHQSSDEQDKCSLCHKTSAFLLSTPFINYFDFKFSSSNLNISLTSDEINYDEYKPFDNFTFATPTKTRLNNSLLSQLISPSDLQNDLKEIQMDFEFNGKIIGKKDRLKSCSVNDINRLFPAQQNLDTCDFQPTVVSTPSKYLQNQQYYQLSGKNINNNQQSQMETSYNSSFSWKKAIVLDPRLSASYDAVFPSLEVSFNSDCTKQSTNLNTTTENVSYFFNK